MAIVALIVVNLIPLAGVLFAGWQPGEVLVIYWGETVVIGLYCILKLPFSLRWFALIAVPFFIVHFGVFAGVSGVFTFLLCAVIQDVKELRQVWESLGTEPLYYVAAAAASHGFSFLRNFIGRREYLVQTDVNELMIAAYRRVFGMLATALLGGVVIAATGAPALVMVPFIVAKMIVDLHAHRAERRRGAPQEQPD